MSGAVSTSATPVPPEVRERYYRSGLWGGRTLRNGIEAGAARFPDRTAVIDNHGSWTYGELEQAVARAADALRGLGAGHDRPVLVVTHLSYEGVVAYAAATRCGSPVVMLDRKVGRDDVDNAVRLTRPALVVSTPALAERLHLDDLGLPVTPFADLLAHQAAWRDWDEPDPDQPIVVVFTSGTTSAPKGVVHSVNTLLAGAQSFADCLGFGEADALFLSTPIASITGLLQVHLALDRGARLVLEDEFDAVRSLARLRDAGATVIGGAPVIAETLVNQAVAEGLDELPLRSFCLGGTMIPKSLLELGESRFGIVPTRVYGSSEVPCCTTSRPEDPVAIRMNDEGLPAAGAEVRIVGAEADGEEGEILARGPMRALGYLDDGESAEAFTDGGWYRTGDIGRIDAGRLTITGRIKEIVARKGLKVSLAEIDEKARGLDGVLEAASFGTPDEETGERVVLAVQAPDGVVTSLASVTDALRERGLATWKLPEQVVVWDAPLPRTESGKIQRTWLREQSEERPTFSAARLEQASVSS